MDGGRQRKFGGFTTEQLERRLANCEQRLGPDAFMKFETYEAMKAEVAARKAGTSKVFVVPQVGW